MNKFYALKQNKYADEFMLSKKMAYFFITFLTISTFLTFIPNSAGEHKLSDSKYLMVYMQITLLNMVLRKLQVSNMSMTQEVSIMLLGGKMARSQVYGKKIYKRGLH